MPIIQADSISFSYKTKKIFSSVSFSLDGEILIILGPNGIGKTTLIKCLCGLLSPQSGTVYLGNQPITDYTLKERAGKITFLTQEQYPSHDYTVENIVLMGRLPHASLLGLPTKIDREIAEEAMVKTKVIQFRNRDYRKLSGGERKLVLIAKALCQQTNLIVLDEPTSSLDIKNFFMVFNILEQLNREEKKTIIFSIHDFYNLFSLKGKALLLYDDTRYDFDDIGKIVTKANIMRLFNIDSNLIHHLFTEV